MAIFDWEWGRNSAPRDGQKIWPLEMGRKSPVGYIRYGMVFRTYPGSEFVVAKTLAKWKKLEPNKIDFSQVLARK